MCNVVFAAPSSEAPLNALTTVGLGERPENYIFSRLTSGTSTTVSR